jgi:hypothetical protein
MKVWFVLYLMGQVATVTGPLPYGVGHCWAKSQMILDQLSVIWDGACIETNGPRPRLGQTIQEVEETP